MPSALAEATAAFPALKHATRPSPYVSPLGLRHLVANNEDDIITSFAHFVDRNLYPVQLPATVK
ncbi:hypothetical protein B0H14DRAFT_3426301 [Mycena olivaceomarginata]|nr:hypothetical protein B0H14DRAFT_3426301 [Mycena olivaceomarginata]